mmetsp:Transcript_18489/g.51072  ORF Transcript_18489/g.51072 Transcript_18489/m.51072 type:complete len:163 (+) Transcript_18489:166-654(+)|eukprot:CAMPEP_0113669336 /NCGR_PEP_ID=MMETSP0038_2-20120614/4515_1 /TAXON_ID=2898 /ORGANISM="Cryptomonas paramecium" /LENGTH=162 /DNA_ID=CAMNT_0000585211 /DNA_START=165 /DNA_END=653 /DNA_ORIENTATION=- /assembly_acc=CAM_ASM_000170
MGSFCTKVQYVELTEQRLQSHKPVNESVEDQDRNTRVRAWIMALEEVPKEVQRQAMEEYMSITSSEPVDDASRNETIIQSTSACPTPGALQSVPTTPRSVMNTQYSLVVNDDNENGFDNVSKGPSMDDPCWMDSSKALMSVDKSGASPSSVVDRNVIRSVEK